MSRERLTGRGEAAPENAPAPTEERLPDGQHADHWVLSEEERAKGFVRPVRLSYVHAGPLGPQHPTRELTEDERERFGSDWAAYEPYPPDPEGRKVGKFWTQADLDKVGKGCGTVTSMPQAIAETYAREPSFYGSTFCCGCRDYFPVAEFVWDKTDERVGS